MFQTVLTLLLVLAATLWLARLAYRTFTQKSGCGTSCNCGPKNAPAAPTNHKPQTVFFPTDDLIRRYKARH